MASKLAFHSLTYTFLTMIMILNMNIISSTSSSPFDFLKHLQGCKKGDNVQGIRDLKNYLQHFGYLTRIQTQKHSTTLDDEDNHVGGDDDFDDGLESAIKTYQINYNLKPTGVLDPKTLFKMMKPRCGVPDIMDKNTTRMRSGKKRADQPHHHHHHTVSHYSFFEGEPKWPASKFNLTYGFHAGTPSEAVAAVGRAFNTWASNTQFRFSMAQENENPDITVSFERGNHGDGDPFDGAGGTLAHAFSPPDGRLHFDAEESWAVGAVADSFDVETVALHEIGHILGLQHSSVEGAIMYPEIGAGATKGLHGDDIQGINALYNVV
ncbi:metalloendoproteinase 2-MMP-like [Humulus lupulus]|uniref:metalloendoproteinase 2-MMP-like n=1 Tax=Humulus lupulus TaxID=3486 RepID=UPI002B403FCA|nr:metalloendoproteinase 2-MMP-like [Humulus lupulus]